VGDTLIGVTRLPMRELPAAGEQKNFSLQLK
jgi:hypothetical protein